MRTPCKIKEILSEDDVKIDKLAQYLNLDSSMVYAWKNEKYIPSTNNLIKISEYFDCSLDYLLSRTEDFGKGSHNQVSNFKDRLKIVMKQNKISTYKITRKDKLFSSSCFTRWLSGNALPSPEMLIKLADYFGVTIDYLLGRE